MKLSILMLACIFLFGINIDLEAKQLISIERNSVLICTAKQIKQLPSSFQGDGCYETSAENIDPQNTAVWVKATLDIPDEMKQNKLPHSIFISGKTSSRVYFNNQLVGSNGQPSLTSKDEVAGNIDVIFYVKPNWINNEHNELILLLSSHQGYINLTSPINFIGFGIYAEPSYFLQKNIWSSFIPLGAFILGVIYFAVSCFNPYQKKMSLLFLLMSVFATLQLLAELSRVLFSYKYPIQDVRLIFVVSMACSFGFCILYYVMDRFKINYQRVWFYMGNILTLLVVFLVPGFDPKAAVAILLPCILSIIILAIYNFKLRTNESLWHLVVLMIIALTIVFTLVSFHDVLFYYVITGLLIFLFVQQALNYSKEQSLRKDEERQVSKLRFKLEQNEQRDKPNKIKITSAGKIDLISSNQIYYCKASGDYVEIYLKKGKELLFSGSLKELEKLLPTTFLRVHRSYIVNMNVISSLKSVNLSSQRNSKGSGSLLLDDSSEVPVSRRIMPMVRDAVKA